jgi:hypothetical protein
MTKQVENNETSTETVPGLGMGDLVTISRIIDLASKRGAFSAEESAIVGAVWTRLAAFLRHNMPAEEAPAQAEAPAEAPTEAPATEAKPDGWVDPTPQTESK